MIGKQMFLEDNTLLTRARKGPSLLVGVGSNYYLVLAAVNNWIQITLTSVPSKRH